MFCVLMCVHVQWCVRNLLLVIIIIIHCVFVKSTSLLLRILLRVHVLGNTSLDLLQRLHGDIS